MNNLFAFFVVGEQKMEKGHIWTVGELFHYWYFFIIIVKRLFDFPHYRLTGFFYCLFSLSRMYYYYFIELKRPWFIFNNIVSTDYMQLCKLESCLEIWLILFQLTPKNNKKNSLPIVWSFSVKLFDEPTLIKEKNCYGKSLINIFNC